MIKTISLDPVKIVETVERLKNRVAERFPGSGLEKVAGNLLTVSQGALQRIAWNQRPNLLLRAGIGLSCLGLAAVFLEMLSVAKPSPEILRVDTLLVGLDSFLGSLAFIGGMLVFLLSLESRLKRKKTIESLYELRVIAHIIDMHQLTKDPEAAFSKPTPSSPQRTLTPQEISRYFGYCSEMLALVSKIATLYTQGFSDPVVLSEVDQLEDLTTGLSQKIWQKTALLHRTMEAPLAGKQKPPKRSK